MLARELELERTKNRHLPHEIRSTEAHKSEALGRKVLPLSLALLLLFILILLNSTVWTTPVDVSIFGAVSMNAREELRHSI